MKVQRKHPINLIKSEINYFEHEFEKEIIAKGIINLKNIFLNTDGIIFNQSLKINKNSFRTDLSFFQEKRIVIGQIVKKQKIKLAKETTYSILFDNWTAGYFHWFGDFIPKLIAYQKQLENTIIPLPSKFNVGFYKESLKVFNTLNFLFFEENQLLQIPTVRYIGNIAQSGNYNELIMQKMRTLFSDFHIKNQQKASRNIYISRAKAVRRKVINETELLPILKKYNFEILYFEELTFEEQIHTIFSCKNLISIHGAGLTNMLFMQKNNNVLEFKLKNDFTNLCYFSLASALEINYYYQLADFDNLKTETFDGNFIIDKTLLEKNIQLMISEK